MASSRFLGSLFGKMYIFSNKGDELRALTEAFECQNTTNSDGCNCSI